MMMLKIALRNIFRHRVRSLVTLSTVVFGCVALIFVGGFFEDIFIKIREGFIGGQSGHIQIYRRGFNEHGRVEPYQYLIDNPDDVKALVSQIPEVNFVTARLEFQGLMSTADNTVSFFAQGIEPDNEKSVLSLETKDLQMMLAKKTNGLPVIQKGQALSEGDSYESVLGEGLADTMGAAIGTPIVLITNTVGGATNALDVNVKGIFFTSQKEFDDRCLRVPLKTAQSLLNTSAVQSLVVKLHNTDDTTKVYDLVKQMIVVKGMDLELRRWEDFADYYNKTVELFDMFYVILLIVVGIVVILGIFNTMNMAVMERISEIGTIMALGTRPSGIMKQFLLEGLVLGSVGGAIGVVVGAVFVAGISEIGIKMPPPPGGTFHWLATPLIVPIQLCLTFVFAIVVGGISSLYPAYKASKLQTVEALRYR